VSTQTTTSPTFGFGLRSYNHGLTVVGQSSDDDATQTLQPNSAIVSTMRLHCPAVSSEIDAVPAAMMAEPLRCGRPYRAPSNSCCPPNLLGGSPRTTAPGCIRPLLVPTHRHHDSRLFSDTVASSSRITGTLVSSASVELLNQHPPCQSSYTNAATRKMTESKPSDRFCLGRQSVGATGRCRDDTMTHKKESVESRHCASGTISSASELEQNSTEAGCEFQSSPLFRSQTLPSDAGGLQSFQIQSSKSPSIADVSNNRSHGAAKFFSRASLKSLRRFFVATPDGSRGRGPAANSSPSIYRRPASKTPAAPAADCRATSKESSSSSSAVRSPLLRWFGRFRRHDEPRHSDSGDITSKTSVNVSNSSASLTAVIVYDVMTDVASLSTDRKAAQHRREQTVNESGTADSCIDSTIPERTPETTGVSRLLQPPTTLDLPHPCGLTTSPRHWQVHRRCSLSSCASAESIGQCSVDVLTSTYAG